MTETSASTIEYPAGVTADGVETPQKLIDATKTALIENDYDVVTTLVSSSVDNEITQRYRSSLDEQRHYLKFDAPSQTNIVYVESGTTYIKSTQDGETNYSKRAAENSATKLHESADIVSMLGGPESLGGILQLGRYTPASLGEYNGREVVSFEFEGVDKSQIDGTVSESDGRLLVAPAGIVFDAALSMTATVDGKSQVYENTFTIDALGSVHVPRPSWVDEQF